MNKIIDVLHGDGTTSTLSAPSTPFGGSDGDSSSGAAAPVYSAEVNELLSQTTDAGIRDAIGSLNFPFSVAFGNEMLNPNGYGLTKSPPSYNGDEGLYQLYLGYNNNLGSNNYSGYHSNSPNISGHAYAGCIELNRVYIASGITKISNGAFIATWALTELELPDSITYIGTNAFQHSGIGTITLPDSLTYLGANAFGNSQIMSITIPELITETPYYGFSDCSLLGSVTLPDNLVTIKTGTFYKCSALTSIDIPSNVTTIGNNVFNGCTSLATINCRASTAPTIGNNVFAGVSAAQIHVPVGATGYGTTYGGLTVVYDL